MILISVLFPAPFSPTSACTSPRRTVKSTPSSAVAPAERLTIRSMRRMGGASGAGLVMPCGVGGELRRYEGTKVRGYVGAPSHLRTLVPFSSVRFRHELRGVGAVEEA